MGWTQRRIVLIGAGAVIVAAVAAGVAVANQGSGSNHRARLAGWQHIGPLRAGPFAGGPMRQRLQVAPGMPAPGRPQFRRFGRGPSFAGALGGVLHGEGTVAGPNGQFHTVEIQRGSVTKVSPGSVTVRSADGFTETYAATASLLRAIAKGDLVQLRATVTGSKATIVSLTDLSRMTRSSTGGEFPPQPR